MLRVLLITLFILLAACQSFGQAVNDFVYFNIYSQDSLRLFDSAVIKQRNITKANVVQISYERDRRGRPLRNDTCVVFKFDQKGQAIQGIYYYYRHKDYQWIDTISLPQTSEHFPYPIFKRTIKTTHLKNGKISTKYLFRTYEGTSDTALIITTKFNLQNQIIEESVIPTNWYFKGMSCREGQPPFHFAYEYDKKNRLTYYRDFYENNYLRISYPQYGELIKSFDSKTNRLIEETVNTITRTEDYSSSVMSITTSTVQVTIAKNKREGNLINFVTVVKNSSFPEVKYYEITYE